MLPPHAGCAENPALTFARRLEPGALDLQLCLGYKHSVEVHKAASSTSSDGWHSISSLSTAWQRQLSPVGRAGGEGGDILK